MATDRIRIMSSQPPQLRPQRPPVTGGNQPPMVAAQMYTGGNQPPVPAGQVRITGGNQPPERMTLRTGGPNPPVPVGGAGGERWQEPAPGGLPTASPVQVMDWRGRLLEGNTSAQTRSVGRNELVSHQLNDLIASNSQYIQQARDRAANEASARGMLMSSVAIGNSQRAAIDAALPIASQDATTYGRTASENMAAVNQDRLADQSMWGQLTGQEVGIRANLDESERARGFTARENALNRNFQSFERQATQAWQEAQNNTQRQHELAYLEHQQAYDAGQRLLDRNFNGAQADKQFLQQRFQMYAQSMENQNKMLADTIASIYNNPNLNASQQAAAVANARQIYQSLFTSYAQALSGGLPQIFWQPYPMPAPSQAPPPGGGGGGGGVGGGGGGGGGGGVGGVGGGGFFGGGPGTHPRQQTLPSTSGYTSPRSYVMDNRRLLDR